MFIDFVKMREMMVQGQLRPHGIVEQDILDVMGTIRRERFVDKHLQDYCYQEKLFFCNNDKDCFMFSPTVMGKIIQALEIMPSDIVLDIGCGTGYSAAVLGSFANTVLSIDENNDYLEKTVHNCSKSGITNIVTQKVENYLTDTIDKAPFDIIFVNGAFFREIPHDLLHQLSDYGRLVTIIMNDNNHGEAVLVSHLQGNYTYKTITECTAPLLLNNSSPDFVF